jgi:hypothetical protein
MNGGGKPDLRINPSGELEGTAGRTVNLTVASSASPIKILAATYGGAVLVSDTILLTIAPGVTA